MIIFIHHFYHHHHYRRRRRRRRCGSRHRRRRCRHREHHRCFRHRCRSSRILFWLLTYIRICLFLSSHNPVTGPLIYPS